MTETERYWAGRQLVYRCYDTDGHLLYVGKSSNLPQRLYVHSRNPECSWFADVARIGITVHPDHASALAAERWAIREEEPLHNVRSTPLGSRRGARLDPRQISAAGRNLLRATLTHRRLRIRDMAELCGGPKYRTAIGHLLTGERDRCSAELAEQLERVCLPAAHGHMFLPTTPLRVVS